MAPLLEAMIVFVGIPALAVASLALMVYAAIAAVRSFAAPEVPATNAGNVVAFRPRTVEVVRDARKAA